MMKSYSCYFSALCGILLLLVSQARAFAGGSGRSSCFRSSFFDRSKIDAANANANTKRKQRLFGTTMSNGESEAAATSTTSPRATVLKPYEYDGWKLTYRTIADDGETESTTTSDEHRNVLLIHPVGIGLSSWFWERLLTVFKDRNKSNTNGKTTRAYAPNLIGCGITEGSQAWDPNKRGLFVPLGWVKGCESLMQKIDDEDRDNTNSPSASPYLPKKWTVVTQGGLAPIGVLLAARNPETISTLVMASPPIWEDMTNAVPQNELERNYWFFTSPILGRLAFAILETRGLVKFFSNQFLFTPGIGCDDDWLDKTEAEMCSAVRPPVQNFNSGMCMNKSLEQELTDTIQNKVPTVVVVQGESDKRPRGEYEQNMSNCRLVTVKGTTNVIPWEKPEALADLLAEV